MSLLNGLASFASTLGAAGRDDAARSLLNSEASNTAPATEAQSATANATPAPVVARAEATGDTTAAKLAAIQRAIYGQESGSGRNTATSITGARGGMQIQPATFQQYARPGENIDNPQDNAAVAQRIIADLWQKSGGDPARVAVGYFSGPGNIAPPDSPTPWVRNAADPTGKTVSSYVSDILKRLGSA